MDCMCRSHFDLMREVPMVGWDVTFTPKGVFLLEVNLSCNFFRGSFDTENYISMVDEYWSALDSYAVHKSSGIINKKVD
jgi:glutathione synthase/RimK-type ligase-like ATP-grasp enzyme